ncbi:hypothetical protein STG2_127 [Salmonella phage STG2]|uniref:Uncharacterized protein n=1 Tax=Salmonella phage STG2 TaxID=2480623 RepID=A0A3G2KAQ3_9CAUD|nr:hypothetical protein HOU44_gp108 [Salmonella phage STG2]AYN56091.1 hypothetical protein STG2_127 [Salmonella phage STG2]
MEAKLNILVVVLAFQAMVLGFIHGKVSHLEDSVKELKVEMCKTVSDNEKCRST